MDGINELLEHLRGVEEARDNFLGVLNVLIGRRIEGPGARVISTGLTWRALAGLLKKLRWDREAVRQLGMDPASLPPRDRERFWYQVISQAHVAAPEASQAGNRLAEVLRAAGYVVGPAPGG